MTSATARLLVDTLRLDGAPLAAGARAAWGLVDAPAVAAAVTWEGGALWLLRRLVESRLEDAAPAGLIAALRKVGVDERARCLLVDAQTEDVLRDLCARGVPHVLIKGSARRAAAQRYPYADARATRDVDVLLPAPSVRLVWESWRAEGWPYATDPSLTPAEHYHPPPLLGRHRVGVELHESTGHAFPPEEGWRRANDGAADLEWHGIAVRVPSATELLWHGLTHAVATGPHGFTLRYFLDGASILGSGVAVDWDRVAARLDAAEDVDSARARAWLGAAAVLAGVALPERVQRGTPPFHVARALAWRLTILGRGPDEGLTARLLEEGTRSELGMPVAPVVTGTGAFKQTRRWVAGRVARAAYRAWRATT